MAGKGVIIMAEAYKLYKLIILYMLDKVDFPLTNSQISEFILNEGYTNYFTLQQTLSELSESGFIREESTHSRTFYHLTDEGIQTLKFFKNDISAAIQDDIDTFLQQKKYELKNEINLLILNSIYKYIDNSIIDTLKNKKYIQYFEKSP